MPVATAAFNDSAPPFLGMVISFVVDESSSFLIPFDSFPMINIPLLVFCSLYKGLPSNVAA